VSSRQVLSAAKYIPGGARPTSAPQNGGAPYYGAMSPLAMQLANERGYANTYGPFLPRPTRTFTDGAFGPFSPILPVPVDAPEVEDGQPDPRLWEYPVGWNLPVGQPGTEGLKLVDFGTLKTIADTYSVARSCIDRRKYEITGLDWDIVPTHEASKAYQGDRAAMKDFGERVAKAKRFFRQPDPDYFTFTDFLSAMLEEIFVYDALAIVMRPKWGRGMKKGVLGSDLDCLELISGPTIRPLVGMHGEVPRPPAPAYQQYLYGVPRSDYMTMITQRDIDEGGLSGSEVQSFRSDQLLYLRTTPRRGTPYGFSLTEKAILPILTGLQKQAYQYDYFREGTVPAVYISPGDSTITPNQIRELQDALNAVAGDPAWHHKIIVLPPNSKTMPQRDAQLADQFDEIVMAEVAMVYDVDPMSLGIIPKVSTVASPFAAKEMAQASKTVHERTSTKPLLKFLADIFNNVLHRVLGQDDMKFTFEGLAETQNESAVSDLIVKQVQYGLRSVDEGRAELELPPWNLPETSGPVVFTQMGPVPFEMAPQLLAQQQQGAPGSGSGGNSEGSGKRTRATSTTGRGDQYGGPGVPRHGKPVSAPASNRLRSGETTDLGSRPGGRTPAHDSARGSMSLGSSKPGGGAVGKSDDGVARAVKSELEALGRHLRKGRDIGTWEVRNIPGAVFEVLIEDMEKGLSYEEAAAGLLVQGVVVGDLPKAGSSATGAGVREWPGWKHDLGLVGSYVEVIRKMFSDAESDAEGVRGEFARGVVSWTPAMYRDAMHAGLEETVRRTLEPLWRGAWELGWKSAGELVGGAGDGADRGDEGLERFLATEGRHWTEVISRTGLKDAARRSEAIARTEVQRAMMTAALQRYREAGVSYKELMVAPGDLDGVCADAASDGMIPLDATFDCGEVIPPLHVQCRCAIAPAGVEVVPPQAHIGKSEDKDKDKDKIKPDVAFLLIRARNEEGKLRYLLQKRAASSPHGETWGLPGGKAKPGETAWQTALREANEETGGLPELGVSQYIEREDGKRKCSTFICDVSGEFMPSGGGTTPWETAGWGWFGRREIEDLPLHPGFRETWDVYREHILGKARRRSVSLSGQETNSAAGGGASGVRTHDARDRSEWEMVSPGGRTGMEPPRWGGDEEDRYVSMPGGPGGAAGRVEKPPPSGGSAGSYRDRSMPRARADDGDVPDDEDDANAPFVRGRPPNGVGKSGASDYSDPNPVDAEHVYSQLLGNYPPDSIQWVRSGGVHWIGPVLVPADRVDIDDEESWSASHQGEAVDRFAEEIRDGTGHLNPVVMVQSPEKLKAIVVDGHHRYLAYRKLGQPVKAYVGLTDRVTRAMLETHSSQTHQGADADNK
jgi:8-oxo-dGTP pyrophosphatase MutT (NUDIX family)